MQSEPVSKHPKIIILMGITGAGKTTIGRLLAAELGWQFFDGDDFHPPGNIAKMFSGIPLTDADREPWLAALNNILREHSHAENGVVMACSALKASYRDRLIEGVESVIFIYLKADEDVLARRLAQRTNHFMPANLLYTQLDILEEPTGAFELDASLSPTQLVSDIIAGITSPEV